MSKGRVLVIDDDEWVCRLLAVAMREAGFEITITENAAEGFFRAVEEQPDCIVCDVDLPDHNGYWVAKKIRAHPSKIAMAPFVFLSGLDDREHRLEGFQVGGDAYLTKPFRIDEVVAQVDALIQMAARLRKTRQTLASIPPPQAAMFGDLAQMSVGTLLTLLDLERRSGTLELKNAKTKAQIRIVNGGVVATTIDGADVPPLETIRKAMVWNEGKFSFTPSEERTSVTDATPINALLMEAARLEDEARAGEGRPSSNRIASWKDSIGRHTPRPFAPPSAQPISSDPFASRPAPPGEEARNAELPPLPTITPGAPPVGESKRPDPRAESEPPTKPETIPPSVPAPTLGSRLTPVGRPPGAADRPSGVVPGLGRPPGKITPAPFAAVRPPPDRQSSPGASPLGGGLPRPGERKPTFPGTPIAMNRPPTTTPSGSVPRTSSLPGGDRATPTGERPSGIAPPPPPAPPKPATGTPLPGVRPTPAGARAPLPPRTAFSPMRSLSPARGIRAVTPPTPIVTDGGKDKPVPSPPKKPTAAELAARVSNSGVDSLDAGWSAPPLAPEDDEPLGLEDPTLDPPKR